jgi:hypothetical protein
VSAEKLPSAPPGLDAPGRNLWRDVLTEFELSSAEHAVLETACRALDRVRAAEKIIVAEGLTTPGRWGAQQHPAVIISRDAAAAMRAALKQIRAELDSEDAKVSRPGPRPQTKIRAQKKAIAESKARWGT